jgi:hypothetical protein
VRGCGDGGRRAFKAGGAAAESLLTGVAGRVVDRRFTVRGGAAVRGEGRSRRRKATALGTTDLRLLTDQNLTLIRKGVRVTGVVVRRWSGGSRRRDQPGLRRFLRRRQDRAAVLEQEGDLRRERAGQSEGKSDDHGGSFSTEGRSGLAFRCDASDGTGGEVAGGTPRPPYLGVGLSFFCPLRPRDVDLTVFRISLFVLTLPLCIPTLLLRVRPCPFAPSLCTHALVLPLPFVPEVAVGTAPFANVVPSSTQFVP